MSAYDRSMASRCSCHSGAFCGPACANGRHHDGCPGADIFECKGCGLRLEGVYAYDRAPSDPDEPSEPTLCCACAEAAAFRAVPGLRE